MHYANGNEIGSWVKKNSKIKNHFSLAAALPIRRQFFGLKRQEGHSCCAMSKENCY